MKPPSKERYEASLLLALLRSGDLVLGVPEIYDSATLTSYGVRQTLKPFHAAETDTGKTRTLVGVLEAFVEERAS